MRPEQPVDRRTFAKLTAGAALGLAACRGRSAEKPMGITWLPATPEKLPRWRGFNLLEMFQQGSAKPFAEADFQMIHDWGFNFVRLPMDYRAWITGGDWTQFAESALQRIDQAVAFGEKYGVHVMLNFHRAPGYTVAQPAEKRSLWTDPEAQRVCALHWATFAKRYKGVPNERVSFDLFNEPGTVTADVYVKAVEPIVAAIREQDPGRLIVSDGLQWGNKPIPELAHLKLAQSTRGYTPMEVSHYQASWIGGADKWALPTWPMVSAQGMLYAPTKSEMKPEAREPLRLAGPFAAGATLRLHLMSVSGRATLVVRADGQETFRREFVCGPGEGEWKKAVEMPQYHTWQNLYDRDYEAKIPPETKAVEVQVVAGDWLQLNELGVTVAGTNEEHKQPLLLGWNEQPAQLAYQPDAAAAHFKGTTMRDREWLWRNNIKPWQELEAKGVGIIVGEFGAHNRTPHPVVLSWLEDSLANWQKAGWGWAMWCFRGSFGILDSGRQDVAYENVAGHKLDRKLLELLQRY